MREHNKTLQLRFFAALMRAQQTLEQRRTKQNRTLTHIAEHYKPLPPGRAGNRFPVKKPMHNHTKQNRTRHFFSEHRRTSQRSSFQIDFPPCREAQKKKTISPYVRQAPDASKHYKTYHVTSTPHGVEPNLNKSELHRTRNYNASHAMTFQIWLCLAKGTEQHITVQSKAKQHSTSQYTSIQRTRPLGGGGFG